MKITLENLKLLETKYKGYLEGKILDEFFKEYDIKFAAGHWAAGDFLDRFATKGYFPELKSDIISQLNRVAEAGIEGVEFHDVLFLNPDNTIDDDKINLVKEYLRKLKLKPTNMNINLWTDPKWKMGGIANPIRKVREEALEIALQAVEIAKKVGCESVNLWPGSDGWDYNFEANYGKIIEWFIDGCKAINLKAKKYGLRFGVEAKLHEPREGNMIIPTTHIAAFIAYKINEECGGRNMGVTIDYGHEQMYASEPAATVYFLYKLDVPIANIHINTAKLHSNDEDRVAGTGDIWRLVDYLYALIDTNYGGWIGEDQFTYRMDPVKAMRLSREFFGNLFKKALKIYLVKDRLEEARSKADQAEILEIVKKIMLG